MTRIRCTLTATNVYFALITGSWLQLHAFRTPVPKDSTGARTENAMTATTSPTQMLVDRHVSLMLVMPIRASTLTMLVYAKSVVTIPMLMTAAGSA